MPLKSPGEATHPSQSVHITSFGSLEPSPRGGFIWGFISLPTISVSAFRPPGKKPYPLPSPDRHPQESSSTSEQPPHPAPNSHLNRERYCQFAPRLSKETFSNRHQPTGCRLWRSVLFQIHLSSGQGCIARATVAPGFLSWSTSVLLLRDKLSVLLHLCKRFTLHSLPL